MSTNLQKILFLDVDGVLNNYKTLEEAADRNEFDPICGVCLSALKFIVDKTSCDIVLSSTWRNDKWNTKKLKRAFRDVGIPYNFNITPTFDDSYAGSINRHLEIENWLEHHVIDPALVVVIDDDGNAKIRNKPDNVKEIFLQTCRTVGLNFTLANTAIEFFNSQN